MSLENFDCPICGSKMRKGKVKISLRMVLDDGSEGELECPITLCGRCHNMQLSLTFTEKISFVKR